MKGSLCLILGLVAACVCSAAPSEELLAQRRALAESGELLVGEFGGLRLMKNGVED